MRVTTASLGTLLSGAAFALVWWTTFGQGMKSPTPDGWQWRLVLPLITNLTAIELLLVGAESGAQAATVVSASLVTVGYLLLVVGGVPSAAYPRFFDRPATHRRRWPRALARRWLLLDAGLVVFALSGIARVV